MKYIINSDQLESIKKNKLLSKNNSLKIFNDEVRKFLYCTITDNLKNISDYWAINGIKKGDLFRRLKSYGIILEKDGVIIIPKKNFDRKIKRLFYELFDDDTPGILMQEDDGAAADGATTTFSVGGSYETPLSGNIIRRKL